MSQLLKRKLYYERHLLRLTQQSLADKIGCHVNNLHCWECDKQEPSLHNFIAWANALGYKVKLEKM